MAYLIALWEDFKQYKFISDKIITKEFILFILITLKNICLHSSPLITDSLSQVAHISETIDSLPIDELLNTIDTMTEQLIEDDIEAHFNHSLYSLAKKYWWIAPAIIGMVSWRIVHTYIGYAI